MADLDPDRADCTFYHSMDIPGEEPIAGFWDLRGCFEEYVGGIDMQNKTVLDVGTATGFLAFEAEKRGAQQVTAFEIDSGSYQANIPFAGSVYMEDRRSWIGSADENLRRLKNSFWYCHKRYNSKVKTIYGSFFDLVLLDQKFDIVIAGALLEHIADPVSAIGLFAKLARETLVIASTPSIISEDVYMRPANAWNDPRYDYTWYELSIGMYRRVLANVGFRVASIHFVPMVFALEDRVAERPTIVARRVT